MNSATTGEEDSRPGAEAEVEVGGDGGAQGEGRETGKKEMKREIQNRNSFSFLNNFAYYPQSYSFIKMIKNGNPSNGPVTKKCVFM